MKTNQALAGLSLLFAAGDRPSATDIEHLLGPLSTECAYISYRRNEAEGWLEVVANGFTLDLTGLAPAAGTILPPIEHQFGICLDLSQFRFEAITISPRLHAPGEGAMLPAVRTMAGFAAKIALPLLVKGLCWHPARSWMEPNYFTRIVLDWLSGGAFPALD